MYKQFPSPITGQRKEGLLYKELIRTHVLIIKQGEVGGILQECHDDTGGHKGIHVTS